MSDQKVTHLPPEGEGTPLLPGNTDLKPNDTPASETESGKPIVGDVDLVPPGASPGTGQ